MNNYRWSQQDPAWQDNQGMTTEDRCIGNGQRALQIQKARTNAGKQAKPKLAGSDRQHRSRHNTHGGVTTGLQPGRGTPASNCKLQATSSAAGSGRQKKQVFAVAEEAGSHRRLTDCGSERHCPGEGKGSLTDIADLLNLGEKLDSRAEIADEAGSHIGSTLGERFLSSAGARPLLPNKSLYNA